MKHVTSFLLLSLLSFSFIKTSANDDINLALNELNQKEYDINLSVKPRPTFYNSILNNFWSEIPNIITLRPEVLDDDASDDLTSKLEHGTISLGAPGKKLFTVTPIGENKIRIDWDLNDLKVNMRIRVDWDAPIINSTHFIFKVDASQIKSASTTLQVNYDEVSGKFQLGSFTNSSFSFQNFHVESDSTVLNWIMDSVDGLIHFFVNREVRQFINSEDTFNKLQGFLRKEIKDLDLKMSDFPAKAKIKFSKFGIQEKSLNVSVKGILDNSKSEVHPCATGLIEDQRFLEDRKDDSENFLTSENSLVFSHSLIERVVLNLATYKIKKKSTGKIKQPIFCIGYKEMDEDGNGLGDQSEFDFEVPLALRAILFRKHANIKFNLWAKPLSKPTFNYELIENVNEEGEVLRDHRIKASIKALVTIKNTGGKKDVKFKDTKIKTTIEGVFRLKMVKGEGIKLEVISFKLPKLKGVLKVNINRLVKVPVPFSLFKGVLEDLLYDEVKEDLDEDILLDEIIPFLNMKLKLNEYDMIKDHHRIKFHIVE